MFNRDKLSKIQHVNTVARQRFSFLLILILAITPVTSAFGYYSGMTSQLSAEPSLEQGIAIADMTNDTGDVAAQNSDQCHQQNKVKTACHANSSCSFHVCGDGGITPIFLFVQAYSSNRYEHSKKSTSSSFLFSPDIRPPISSL
ncbi:MAG: hypothetical protein WAW61_11685 [Methylococcaceae bacterium]